MEISGERLGAKAAMARLHSLFTSSGGSGGHSGSNNGSGGKLIVVCLVDELDFLMKSDSVVYNLFDWPQYCSPKASLIVVGISNMMDLPARFSTRVASRLQAGYQHLIFAPYRHEQIEEIMKSRLQGLDIFTQEGLNYVARKSASSGDLRAALKICQRSIEIFRDSLDSSVRQAGASIVST